MMRTWGLLVLGLLISFPALAADAPSTSLPVVAPKADAQKDEDLTLFNAKAVAPDADKIPMLANLKKQGAKLFYLGERSGLNGWFAFTPSGVQIVYVTPDTKTVLVGGMFTSEGKLVTARQVQSILESNKDLSSFIGELAKQQLDATKAGATKDGFASLPQAQGDGSKLKISTSMLPSVSLSPGDRLLQDVQAAPGVTLGKGDAPILYMIISPECPYCKKTWTELRENVQKNQLRVKLILLSDGDPGKAHLAARLLQVENPMEAWDKFVGGDIKVLNGDTDEAHLKAAISNDALIDRWDIRVTPYLSYRAKDGKVKIIQGRPDRIAGILTDIAP